MLFHANVSALKRSSGSVRGGSGRFSLQQSSTLTFRRVFYCRRWGDSFKNQLLCTWFNQHVSRADFPWFYPEGNHRVVPQTAKPVALNGMNHRANAQVTAAVLITNGRCLLLFLKSHSFTLPHTHTLGRRHGLIIL